MLEVSVVWCRSGFKSWKIFNLFDSFPVFFVETQAETIKKACVISFSENGAISDVNHVTVSG
jgi:hypothetical protein